MLAVFSHPSLFTVSTQWSVLANFQLPLFFFHLLSYLLIGLSLSFFSTFLTSISHLYCSSFLIFFCFVPEKQASMYALRYSILSHYCPYSILTQAGYIIFYFPYSLFRLLPSVVNKIDGMIFELYFLSFGLNSDLRNSYFYSMPDTKQL